MVYGSIEWANSLLVWVIKEILLSSTWIHHPYNKMVVAYDVIDHLNSQGYRWQGRILRFQLHKWMRSISLAPPKAVTLSLEERGGVS